VGCSRCARRGVGDALIAAVVSWAKRQHAQRVMLAVVPGNTHAIELYRRSGFIGGGRVDGEQVMVLSIKS
jgi:ribosomal protein S18 acetylase RimI-like enzyme